MPRSVGNKLSEEFLAMRKIFIAFFCYFNKRNSDSF